MLAQTHEAAEIIVVDDGSSDGTNALVERHYPGVKLLTQGNQGVSSARNAGASVSTGEWLAFLDSDDEWLPEKLSHQLACVRDNPHISLIHSDEIWIRRGVRVNQMRKHRKPGGQIFEYCLPRCVISPSAVMMSKALFDRLETLSEASEGPKSSPGGSKIEPRGGQNGILELSIRYARDVLGTPGIR